jgi:hypothetical protein
LNLLEKAYIEVTLFFRVKNAKMWGGIGSEGYAEQRFGGVRKLENLDEAFITDVIAQLAAFNGVPKEDIILISKEEYEAQTEDDD